MKKAYWQIIAAAVLWGIIGIFVRAQTALGLTALQVTFLRVTVAALALAPVLAAKDKTLFQIRLRHLWCFAGTGIVSMVLFNVCLFSAGQHMSLAAATVLLYTAPAFVMLFSALLFKEKITLRRLCALALVFGGCVLVTGLVGGGGRFTPRGVLYGLGAGVGYALYSIFGRYALQRGYSTYTVTFYTFAFAAAGSLPFAAPAALAGQLSLPVVGYALGTGVLCGALPFLLYTKGLTHVENSTASMLATLEPAVAAVVSVLVFHEPLSATALAGIALLFGGILLLAKK